MRLIGKTSSRDPVGAWVELEAGKEKLIRYVKSGAGYCSHSDEMTIHWPSGKAGVPFRFHSDMNELRAR